MKAHGGKIDIQGITIAHVDDKVRLQNVETWFDPMEMFRQIARDGEVIKVARDEGEETDKADSDTAANATTTGCPVMRNQ